MYRSLLCSALILILALLSLIHVVHSTEDASFSFIQLTDVHIGGGGSVPNLHRAIRKMNEIAQQRPEMRFVLVSGDLTHSMDHKQLFQFKKMMQELKLPYIPMLGNHDIWSYSETYEEPFPTGDVVFGKVYMDHMRELRDRHGMALDFVEKSCKNQEHKGIESHFLNFEFRVNDNLSILGLDWNSRKSAASRLGYKGSWPGAELHDFECGTMKWLEAKLQHIRSRANVPKNIIIAQHHPFRTPKYVPSFIYGFSSKQKKAVRAMLTKYLPVDTYWGILSGHWHRWYDEKAFDEKEWSNFRQFEGMASLTDGSFAIVNMAKDGYSVASIEQITP